MRKVRKVAKETVSNLTLTRGITGALDFVESVGRNGIYPVRVSTLSRSDSGRWRGEPKPHEVRDVYASLGGELVGRDDRTAAIRRAAARQRSLHFAFFPPGPRRGARAFYPHGPVREWRETGPEGSSLLVGRGIVLAFRTLHRRRFAS